VWHLCPANDGGGFIGVFYFYTISAGILYGFGGMLLKVSASSFSTSRAKATASRKFNFSIAWPPM